MSLNHLTNEQQGVNDKLRIGCHEIRASDSITISAGQVITPVNNVSRFTYISCDVDDTKTGTGYGYSWSWPATGDLRLVIPNSSLYTKTIVAVSNQNTPVSFCSACEPDFDTDTLRFRFTISVGTNYAYGTLPVKITVMLTQTDI